MEERHWLRHPSLTGHLGPFSQEELQSALEANAFPPDSYVLLDAQQSEQQRQASVQWQPVAQLLGLPPSLPTSGQGEQEPATMTRSDIAREHVRHLRSATAYKTTRSLITFCAALWIFVNLIAVAIPLIFDVGMEITGANWMEQVIDVMIALIVAGILRALLDIADVNVRNCA